MTCQLAPILKDKINKLFIDEDQTIAISALIEHLSEILEKMQYDEAAQDFQGHIRNKLNQLWQMCSQFVKGTCQGRDESHGHTHMQQVTRNALLIILFNNLEENTNFTYYDLEDIIVAGMTHDVADHKYDSSGSLEMKVKNFLAQITGNIKTNKTSAEQMWTIINLISFSKEKKAGSQANLLRNNGLTLRQMFIRNIIADADRIEAIGEQGVIRCIQYTRQAMHGNSEEKIKENVLKHAEEKLYLLPFYYFHTSPGQKWSKLLHQDTIKFIQKFVDATDN